MNDRSELEQRDYREQLYASYRSTHFDSVAPEGPPTTAVRQVLRHLPDDNSARILELGSGSGALLRAMRDAGFASVSGVDVSEEQVAKAREGGIEVDQGDLTEHLEGLPEPVDAILAVDVLEHLTKPEVVRALRAARAALRPGGRLIARMPNAQSPFGGRYRYGDFTHETSFTQHSARQVLLATGFSEVKAYPAEPVVHGPLSALRWVLWKLTSGGLKLALAAETGELRGQIVTQNLVVVATA